MSAVDWSGYATTIVRSDREAINDNCLNPHRQLKTADHQPLRRDVHNHGDGWLHRDADGGQDGNLLLSLPEPEPG